MSGIFSSACIIVEEVSTCTAVLLGWLLHDRLEF